MPEGSGHAATYNKILPQLQALTDAMKEVGATKGASTAQVAIAWAISKGTLLIIGATKVHHVSDAAKAAELHLINDKIARIEKLSIEAGVNTRGSWENNML